MESETEKIKLPEIKSILDFLHCAAMLEKDGKIVYKTEETEPLFYGYSDAEILEEVGDDILSKTDGTVLSKIYTLNGVYELLLAAHNDSHIIMLTPHFKKEGNFINILLELRSGTENIIKMLYLFDKRYSGFFKSPEGIKLRTHVRGMIKVCLKTMDMLSCLLISLIDGMSYRAKIEKSSFNVNDMCGKMCDAICLTLKRKSCNIVFNSDDTAIIQYGNKFLVQTALVKMIVYSLKKADNNSAVYVSTMESNKIIINVCFQYSNLTDKELKIEKELDTAEQIAKIYGGSLMIEHDDKDLIRISFVMKLFRDSVCEVREPRAEYQNRILLPMMLEEFLDADEIMDIIKL